MRIQPSLGPIKTSIGGGSSNIGGEDYIEGTTI